MIVSRAKLSLIGLGLLMSSVPVRSEQTVPLPAQADFVLCGRQALVALGLVPNGPKQREGDFKTPEGRYVLDARNVNSDYFLSIHVSYPDESDRARARAQGVDPGNGIMIHGLPNELKRDLSSYRATDWTDGCIAVSNSDMVDIWLMVRDSTPIEIRP